MYLDFLLNIFGIGSIKRINKKQGLVQLLNVSTMFTSAYMTWKLLGSIVNHYSPFVVVLSESMSPEFHRGDILFITMFNEDIKCGDIVVFETKKNQIPIVHRVLNTHLSKKTNKKYFLTKGDNNSLNDRGLYNRNQLWLNQEHIKAKIQGFIPYVGMLSIIIKENPLIKNTVVLSMCLFTLFTRD